ncbi:MAG: polyamine aminopropyltransferase, partial [Myxococcales bacterium]|nr:polyamine aminopropyltransferase [Myxococcales bacterium]
VRTRVLATLVAALLVYGFVRADELTTWTEQDLYDDPIVFATQSPYQRIVVTKHAERTSLFLNGNLQFSSLDEHRYHEALVHPVMASAARRERVLVLGGGDGLALREVFRYGEVREVTLVDLDRAMTETASRLFGELAEHSLDDPRLTLVHDDALVWLDERAADAPPFDVVIVDFPDPNHFGLGKLYTSRFYRLVRRALADDGAMVVQSTSPLFARRSYWCVEATMREAGLRTAPYHATVPSFGAWGFVLARESRFEPPTELAGALDGRLRFLTNETLPSLFLFPADMSPVEVETNRLNDQTLVRYYEAETRRLER